MDTRLIERIVEHEGLRQFPYKDTLGVLTIGIGRNLTNKGLSKTECYDLLTNDLISCNFQLLTIPFYKALDAVRKDVLVELCFNMGFDGLRKFKKMWSALEQKDYSGAVKELLDSEWAKQVGKSRIDDICYRMENGAYRT